MKKLQIQDYNYQLARKPIDFLTKIHIDIDISMDIDHRPPINYNNKNINQIQTQKLTKQANLNQIALINNKATPEMQQKERLFRISRQLTKLNNLIEYTKNQSIIALQALKNCHDSSQSSSVYLEEQRGGGSHNVSQMFQEADSRSTILMGGAEEERGFNGSMVVGGGGELLLNGRHSHVHNEELIQNERNERQQNSRSQFDMHASSMSSDGFKESTIEISQIKPVDTTVKKAKLLKSNMHKNKKTLFDKQRVLSKNEKMEKINRIKSENKFISNTSTFKRGINLIKEQLQAKHPKPASVKTASQTQHNITIPNKNYLSNKIETLNSKRNLKYNSVTKDDGSKNHKANLRVDKNSKSKFHINLQKEVTMKITDLKIKKNLCLVETSYLSASVKVTKQEIAKIEDSSTKYSDETLLKNFILKSIIKFISQYNDQTWTNSEDIEIDSQTVFNTIKKPEKFIKIINKLPDILRRKNIVSESICKEFIEDKSFIDQKLNLLANNGKVFHKEPLYVYLAELHLYIQFLLNNSMIHETKRHKIFNPTSEEFFSDRSAKDMKLANTVKETKFESKNKDFSERKKPGTAQLKRVNTSKALKKGTTMTKPKNL